MNTATDNALECLVDHLVATQYEDLPTSAVDAAKVFILDSLGVGICGSRVPWVSKFRSLVVNQWGQGAQARVWGTGESLPAISAAMLNAYQIHNQEYDCVHEPSVVHALATILSALTAYAEKEQGVNGRQFITAVILAVDVATTIGMAAKSAMRFFRPGVCGCLGATAAMAKLEGLSKNHIMDALGIAYSQLGGTMQAHLEGSPVLAMQIAFNARNALTAVDLAKSGLRGPRDILEGQFGFYHLFEPEADIETAWRQLGRTWQITQISHKPFPTGRAAHGAIDALITLQKQHGFSAAEVEKIRISAPPLILRLVNRPMHADMNENYARLCMGFIAAVVLQNGSIDVTDYRETNFRDEKLLRLAQAVEMQIGEMRDPNALAPQRVEITLKSAAHHTIDLPHIYGSPQNPMSREAYLEKFRRCCGNALTPLAEEKVNNIIATMASLEDLADVRSLVDLTVF